MINMAEVVEWLLAGEPYIEYQARIDLLGQATDALEVLDAKTRLLETPEIRQLLWDLHEWPGVVLSSHKSASQPFHKLSFLADIGLTKADPALADIAKQVFKHQSDEGPFQLPTNIPKHFGGSGVDTWAWSLCDAPIIIYSLAKFGYDKDTNVQKAAKYVIDLVHDNGWRCTVSKELGKFRGPGRKDDPCPYATLVMLKMITQFQQYQNSEQAHAGAECLLDLWHRSREVHPYLFYMGNDFRKLKAPFIWYDVLHVLDVLSQFSWLKSDSRLIDMANLVRSKAGADGRFTPESEWQAWKGWDFGQKKQPSRWLTLLVIRMLRRLE